jgi:glucose-6-phosphate isomerase
LPKALLSSLFATGDDRLKLLVHDSCGMCFDFAKTHLTADAIAAFEGLARAQDFAAKRRALFAGGIVNPSEGRAAEHTAQRGEGRSESVALAKSLHDRMRALIDAIEAEALGPVRHIVHIGIGGSALGPDLIVDALSGDRLRYDVAIVSNVDGYALENAIADFDPAATLIVVASKTFTTTETMHDMLDVTTCPVTDAVAAAAADYSGVPDAVVVPAARNGNFVKGSSRVLMPAVQYAPADKDGPAWYAI